MKSWQNIQGLLFDDFHDIRKHLLLQKRKYFTQQQYKVRSNPVYLPCHRLHGTEEQNFFSRKKKGIVNPGITIESEIKDGALGRIRTPDPLVRSQILYPTELPAHRTGGVAEVAYFPCFSNEVKGIIAHFSRLAACFHLLLVLLLFIPEITLADGTFIKVGVLNNQSMPDSEVIRLWEPTADYLAMKLPGYDFEIIPLGYYEVEAAVGQGKVDFILTNPGIFVSLAARNWVVPLATMNNVIGDESYSQYGGVIFTRSDNDSIQTLADLRGKRVAAVNEASFGGFLTAWRELHALGIDPYNDLFQLTFTQSHRKVVSAVLESKALAGIVRTGTLEQLLREHQLEQQDIKIINPMQSPDFPLVHSTRLYPEWPFSKVQHTNTILADKVALALLRMPSDFPSRFTGGYAKWTLPRNYSEAHTLFKEIKLPPYAFADTFTLSDALKRYWYWPLIGLLTLLALLAMVSIARRRNTRLEAAKQKLEYQYELIVNSVTDGIYGVNTKGQCTFVNRAMQHMTGWQATDLLGKDLQPMLHHTRKNGTPASTKECPMYESFRDNQPHFSSDDIFWRKDGRCIDVEYSSTPIKDRTGKTIGGVVVFRDISERKEAREKLQQHELQLSHVARLSMLGEMASGIAHEINQPLTAIATNSKACIRMLESRHPRIEACADVMEKIAGQAERAGEVIRHIRRFVTKDTPEMKPISIQTLLDAVLDLLHNELQRHDIKLSLNISHPNIQVLAQEIQIEQVLINLVRNAIESLEHKPAHQRLMEISTARKAENKLEIRITDQGPGLSTAIKEQLFDPFVTTKQEGMGLGLSISQGIIEAHGDRIHVDTLQQGVSFYFSLPIDSAQQQSSTRNGNLYG